MRPSRRPPPGCCKNVVVKMRSPPEVNTTSTGLSVPPASAVAVFEAQNAMRLLLQLYVHFIIGPGGIRDIESSLGIKVRDDRPVDEWRSGDELDLETHGQRKSVTVQLDLMCRGCLVSGG